MDETPGGYGEQQIEVFRVQQQLECRKTELFLSRLHHQLQIAPNFAGTCLRVALETPVGAEQQSLDGLDDALK